MITQLSYYTQMTQSLHRAKDFPISLGEAMETKPLSHYLVGQEERNT